MLWIGGQLSTFALLKTLILPSLVCLIAAFFILSFMVKGTFDPKKIHLEDRHAEPMGHFLFYMGMALLAFVPIFRMTTGLPPFMGMLLGLSAMWLITDIVHREEEGREHLRVPAILARIDLSATLFFLGILLSIDALEAAGLLHSLAHWLDSQISRPEYIAAAIGLASAVVDNVPLVAATMGMYDFAQFPQDHMFWQLVAFCAGTGGSILLIGSAAGVVFMGMERPSFMWYVKRISFPAFVGFVAGIMVYLFLFPNGG
jgi:Na+/H+ antiporter NhaD/arsenite permease-like protein